MKSVVCLGGLTIDEIYHVPNFPKVDEASTISNSIISYGGRGALVALTLGMLKVPVSLFTAVGRDFEESGYKDFLKEKGVNLEGIIKSDEDLCFNTKVFIANQTDSITFLQLRNLKFGNPTEVHYQLLDESKIVYFAINDLEFNRKCLQYCAKKDKIIVHNISSEIISSPEYLFEALKNSDILILNEKENNRLLEVEQVEFENLFDKYSRLKYIIVTEGKEGSKLFMKNNKKIKIECVPVEKPKTPLGLSDAYSAGVVYGLYNDWNIKKSCIFGAYLGAASLESNYSFIEERILEKYVNKFEKLSI